MAAPVETAEDVAVVEEVPEAELHEYALMIDLPFD